jgi:DNA-directed RNA polymerase specialized sigma24 family protein
MGLPDFPGILAKLFPAVFHLAKGRVSDPQKASQIAHDVFLLGYRDYGCYRGRSLDKYREHLFRICRDRCGPSVGGWQTKRLPEEVYVFMSLHGDGHSYEEIAEMLGRPIGWAFATARTLRDTQDRDRGSDVIATPARRVLSAAV